MLRLEALGEGIMARPQGYRPRLIWPSFFTCEQLADQDSRVRLLFISLFAHCFDWGKQRFTPGKLQGNTWFYRSHPDAMTEEEIEQSLQLFMDRGLLELHEFEGLRYYLLPTWDERQPVRDRAADLYPQLNQDTVSLPPVNPQETPSKPHVSSREEKGRERKRKGVNVYVPENSEPHDFTCEFFTLPAGFFQRCLSGEFKAVKNETPETLLIAAGEIRDHCANHPKYLRESRDWEARFRTWVSSDIWERGRTARIANLRHGGAATYCSKCHFLEGPSCRYHGKPLSQIPSCAIDPQTAQPIPPVDIRTGKPIG